MIQSPAAPAPATPTRDPGTPILEARGVTRQYRMPGETVEALRGVSLAVKPG